MARHCTLGFVVAVLVGCARNDQSEVNHAEFENLSKIHSAYTEAIGKLGHTPKDMKEFRPFLEKQGDPDKLLVSSFDKQPYVILWNVRLQGVSGGSKIPAIIAFDRNGVGGERHVLTITGVTIMSDEQFEEAKRVWKIDS
jgi:hypothetical protein